MAPMTLCLSLLTLQATLKNYPVVKRDRPCISINTNIERAPYKYDGKVMYIYLEIAKKLNLITILACYSATQGDYHTCTDAPKKNILAM